MSVSPAPRRRAPRLPVELSARLRGRTPQPARVVDLSVSGCLVRADRALEPGAIRDVEIELPGGPFHAKARVRQSCLDGQAEAGSRTAYLLGLEFLRIEAGEEEALRRYLASIGSGRART
jgi:c-di-GMP-binding flagellar brake protein YcgR